MKFVKKLIILPTKNHEKTLAKCKPKNLPFAKSDKVKAVLAKATFYLFFVLIDQNKTINK